jgi:uncharacterized protein (DUF1501 family)
LRIESKTILKLDDRVGLNPALKDLHKLWESGDLTVVQGAGYPNPNRSHSRSMEIWQTGSVDPVPDAGWLGRAIDQYPTLGTCHVGSEALPLAVRGRKSFTPSIASLADYRTPEWMPTIDQTRPASELAREIRKRSDRVFAQAKRLEAISKSLPKSDSGTLEDRLTTIRVLIEQDPGLRVFYTSTAPASFDTHAAQKFTHRELLRSTSSAVGKFLNDVQKRGLGERVVVLMFSEFGRRVRENAQGGTDHGTAGPVFLAGSAVRGGLVGPAPDLTNLDSGDLHFAVDFRDIYATVLRRWLLVDPIPVLGRRNDMLPIV